MQPTVAPTAKGKHSNKSLVKEVQLLLVKQKILSRRKVELLTSMTSSQWSQDFA